ncbi:hypothetical protein ACFL0T_07520 [Candidatus Omnitrophota bacterium]
MDFPEKESLNISEKFIPIEVKSVDFKNRINLGSKIITLVSRIMKRADAYQICIGNQGDILLRPVVNIPSKEAWIYKNPKVKKQFAQGLKEAAEGNIEKVKDLDAFFEGL